MLRKIALLLVVPLLLSGCGPKKSSGPAPTPMTKRQIINAIAYKDRPFVAVLPHSTGKLLTLYLDKTPPAPQLDIDIEYLAGNALKGGRTSQTLPITTPYYQGFLLGSCSAGGKCSIDTNITTGTIKTKFEQGDNLQVLKSNFVFVNKELTSTSDQKATFVPAKSTTYLLDQTHGFIGEVDQEVVAEPIIIASTSKDNIQGDLSLVAPDATRILLFDGTKYNPISASKSDDKLKAQINQKPRVVTATIVRDDLKGAKETIDLYLLGPFVAVK